MNTGLALFILFGILFTAYMIAGVANELSRANHHLSNIADRLNDIRIQREKNRIP